MANWQDRPLILVCNDDGITAPGIRALIQTMNRLGDVVVVAPDGPQSGMGHAITLSSTLRCERMTLDAGPQTEYACSGTPVDCVKLAVHELLDRKPDLVVSGINHGSNASVNVIYSGTMSAAVEGAMQGIPSIGFSLLDYRWDASFEACMPWIEQIAKEALSGGMPAGTCLNVNFPKPEHAPYSGLKVCRQAQAKWIEEFDQRVDPRGKSYYWLTGSFVNEDRGQDTDEWALENGFVSVVPVTYDLTAYAHLGGVAQSIGVVSFRFWNRLERAEIETAVGFLVGAGTPWFAWAVLREVYPSLPAVKHIDSDLWEFLLLRLFALGVFINAGLFFAALWAKREGMAMGLLVASILYVIGVGYWRWEYL